jgi:SAM-dependent methyltransferase
VGSIWDSLSDIYDKVAKHYAEHFYDELSQKPFDREQLDRFAESMQDGGRVYEIGCGPGQIARYLKDRGVDVFGLDLSSEMIACARVLNEDIEFECGNMLEMDVSDGTLAGIVAFYSIIHLPRKDVSSASREFHRVLQPGGRVLLTFHGGQGEARTDDWFGQGVSIAANLFEGEEIARSLSSEGFEVEDIIERPPYDFEYQSRRIYLFARKKD